MRYYPKQRLVSAHSRKRVFAFLPTRTSEDVWVWLEWVDQLENNHGEKYYRLPRGVE